MTAQDGVAAEGSAVGGSVAREGLDRRSLALLEFPLIRARLAAAAGFPPGRRLAEALEPSTDPVIVARGLEETSQMRAFVASHPTAGIGGSKSESNSCWDTTSIGAPNRSAIAVAVKLSSRCSFRTRVRGKRNSRAKRSIWISRRCRRP